jgi:hypothetical protein
VRKTPFLAIAPAAAALALAACGGSSGGAHNAAAKSLTSPAPANTSASPTTATATPPATAASTPFLSGLKTITTVGSTVPANGDINPYGIVQVTSTTGKLHAGDILVSNFNAKSNNQGTGTTIVELTPGGKRSVFATISAKGLPGPCPGGVGLTTALSVIPGGDVVVGSLPTTNGKSATAKYGCLIVVNPSGHAVSTIAGKNIQGPWDMTEVSHGSNATLFVSNVFNGGAKVGRHVVKNSTVVRIDLAAGSSAAPKVTSETVIGNKIPWRDDPAALAIGPTGVALGANGTLYVNDTLDNRISAIPQAMTRTTAAADGGSTVSVGQHLKQPLGITIAPGGDLITTNAGDGNMVETTPSGKQVATFTADKKTGAGSLFGLFATSSGIYYVDDGDNTLKLLH